jgi:hypothetical protein
VLSEDNETATRDLLRQFEELRAMPVLILSKKSRHGSIRSPAPFEFLHGYAVIYWAMHCGLAGAYRESGSLEPLLRHLIGTEPNFSRWILQLPVYLGIHLEYVGHNNIKRLLSNTLWHLPDLPALNKEGISDHATLIDKNPGIDGVWTRN